MTYQIAGFSDGIFHSDPGTYVCSTDMICLIPDHGLYLNQTIFRNNQKCILKTDRKVVNKRQTNLCFFLIG